MKPDDRTALAVETPSRPQRVELLHRRAGGICVRVLRGPGAALGRALRWTKGRVLGGSSPLADLYLDDSSLDPVHFELCLDGEQVWLGDLGSNQGTWLGDNLVGEVALAPQAVFSAGDCEIQLLGAELVDVPISRQERFGELHGSSSCMREVFAALERVARADLDVVLEGEVGTGKALAARALHEQSGRRAGPFVVLDCEVLNAGLANGTLFGHAPGFQPGVAEGRPGCFERADGGTLLIGDLAAIPFELQPRLLRALDRREVTRVGEHRPRKVDVRVIAATTCDLQRMVAEGRFRQELYYRLSPVTVHLPPLRERDDDVVLLATRFAQELGGPGWTLSASIRDQLRRYPWPGNVRELRQVLRGAICRGGDGALEPGHLVLGSSVGPPGIAERVMLPLADALEQFERDYLVALLRSADGELEQVARRSKLTDGELRERLRRHGLGG